MMDGSPTPRAAVTLHSAELAAALRAAQRTMARRTKIAVLRTVRLTVVDGTATLRATDLDAEIAVTLPAEGGPLDICVDPTRLVAACRGHSGAVTISAEARADGDTVLHIAAGDLTMRLRDLVPATDFPVMHFGDAAPAFEIVEGALWKALGNVLPYVSTEETRYYLNGVFFDTAGDRAPCLVATDGHRLASYMLPSDARLPMDCILPTGAAKGLLAELKCGGNRPVTVTADVAATSPTDKSPTDKSPETPFLRALRFTVGDVTLTSKVIDGTYPDYTRVIPARSDDISITLSRAQVARLPTPADVGWPNALALKIEPHAGRLSVKVGEDEVSLATTPGRGAAFGLNVNYLRKFLSRHDPVTIRGRAPGDPFHIDTDDPDLTLICMPMRT